MLAYLINFDITVTENISSRLSSII